MESPETRVHGALVEIHEIGALILGPSGIGKSETALELVQRGHRLVADDVVCIRRGTDGALVGSAPELIRHHIEVRGIGILFVPDLYGPEAVRDEVSVDFVCRIERWREGEAFDRLGLVRPSHELLGVPLPCVVLPARPGGNMATLVDAAVRDQRRRREGVVAVRRLDDRLIHEVQRP
jgi:HPr kinase/phosphorylase